MRERTGYEFSVGFAEHVANEAREELYSATRKFGRMASAHEGWAVIQEEVDELWAEVKADQDPARMRAEALQVAAMAMRFVTDVCDGGAFGRTGGSR